jgi:hypothetical protein
MGKEYVNIKVLNINVNNVVVQAYVIITSVGVDAWNAKVGVYALMKN